MYQRVDSDGLGAQAVTEDLLTADEVAALLRMTPAWVYSETRRNRIPHLRLGRYFRYRRSAIEAWMRELEAGPRAPRVGAATSKSVARPRAAHGSSSQHAA